MLKQYLECGKIVSTHGVRGEVKVEPWCDDADFLTQFTTLYTNKGQAPLQIEAARVHKNMALLKLQGVDTLEAAAALRGKILYLNREDAPLEEGQHYWQDLIGLRVLDADDNREYGTLCDIYSTGANDVYAIRFADGKERLIPAIKQVIVATDIENQTMLIRPLKGLFDDEN